ncbi:MAG: glutamine synthetase family protein [Pseudomonadota bacterium]
MPDPQTLEVFLTDPNGVLRGKWLPGSALKKLEKGVAFPFSLMGCDVWGREVHETGLHISSGDKDALCLPVEGRTVPVPWATRETMQAMLAMHHLDGTPFMGDPRSVLAAQVEKLSTRGLTAQVAVELEFFAYQMSVDDGRPHPVGTLAAGPDHQAMYALADLDAHRPMMEAIEDAAQIQGLPISAHVSEAAPGQYEVNLSHTDPLAAADDAVMLKRLIDGVAKAHGQRVTFMAKPFSDHPGNGMHVHVSMLGERGNIFAGNPHESAPDGPAKLRHAVAGLLSTTEEAQLGFSHSFNGFRRMELGSYAPASLCWGENNRSVAIRLPQAEPAAQRIEHRVAGADANPYIVVALVLAGMLKGLDDAQEPPAAVEKNAYEDESLKRLTADMGVALDWFSGSGFVTDALGGEFQRLFTAIKRVEERSFKSHIMSLEHATFL